MQIPLLSGVSAKETAEFITSAPLNLEPIVIDSKISKGQLRSAPGATLFATGPGIDRGAITWNGVCYRVMGTSFVRVNADGSVNTLGDVGGSEPVAFDYGFDRLGIASGGKLWYWDGTTLSQVTDPDLGTVLDVIWIDGYFMTTDGVYVPVTELADPSAVLPLKYGSAEEDPDPITGLIKFRKEVYVCGTNTIQVLQNVGGNGFPFAVVEGATIPFGVVGRSAKCLFGPSFAFVGAARGEPASVFVAGSGTATAISTKEVDRAIAAVADPQTIALERRGSENDQRLFVHLPTETWVYYLNASQAAQEPVWAPLRSGFGRPYRLRNATLAYGATLVGDTESGKIGALTDATADHFDEATEWRFDVGLVYNQAKGGLVHAVELVGLPGRGTDGAALFMSMTRDGQTFGIEREIIVEPGERRKRLQWRPHARFANYLGLRFRGYGGLSGFAACEADIRPLSA